MLREHLTRGVSLDRQRFEKNAAEPVAKSDGKNEEMMIRLIENMLALPMPQEG